MTKDFHVDKIVLHPDYNNPFNEPHSNDIALVRLTEEVDISVFTPICLPEPNQDFTGSKATLAGWGGLSTGGLASDTLQELEGLTVLMDDQCEGSSVLHSMSRLSIEGVLAGSF